MRQKLKRWMAVFMIAVVFATMPPLNGVCADAGTLQEADLQASITEQSVQTTQTQDNSVTKEVAEITTEEVTPTLEVPGTEEVANMTPEVPAIEDTENVQNKMPAREEETGLPPDNADLATEDSVTEDTTGITTQEATIENKAALPLENKMNLRQIMSMRIKASSDKEPLGSILSAGAWASGHYKWYVNTGGFTRHYIFCMEKGKMMAHNIFKPSKYSGMWGTAENTFRIAVAMDYFKKHGGWGSEEGYVDAQNVIWKQGGTENAGKLLNYIDNLWKLTQLNEQRMPASDSYSEIITAIKEEDAGEKESRAKLDANVKKVGLNATSSYDIDTKIKITGSAWKYFAGKSDFGSLSVVGCYQSDGTKLGEKTAKASIDSQGNLNIQAMQHTDSKEIATAKDNAILVIMKVNPSYSGATQITYLQTAYNKATQTMSYDATFDSPAYFAVRFYAKENVTEHTAIRVQKTDEYGKEVDGALFTIFGKTNNNDNVYFANVKSGDSVEFDQPGTFYLAESKAPAGMIKYCNEYGNSQVASFNVEEKTENGIKQLYVVPVVTYQSVTGTQDANGFDYTYTVPNRYAQGDAVLHKMGNMLIGFENGKFVYQKRDLSHVKFELYAANDIYAQDTCLFQADQLLTNEVLDASQWNLEGKHDAGMESDTGEGGLVHYYNLPLGKYYVIEKYSPYNGYWISGERIYFDIREENDEEPVQIHSGKGYVNEMVTGKCIVIKENPEKERIKGAEFTLYAHIGNTNFLGENLFTVEQTKPVDVRSKNGKENIVANEWIPIETSISDDNGEAAFDLQLPYGKYLVTETNPPTCEATGKPYAMSEESYEFEHTSENMDAFASGALFTHTFVDEETGNFLLIRKVGNLLSKAEKVETEYGPYQKLVFEPLAAKDITFEIRDIAGNLVEELTTDTKGEAKSKNLKAGTYYIKEIENGNNLKKEISVKEVVIKEAREARVQIEELDFVNQSLNTEFRIFKQAEQVKKSDKIPISNTSNTGSLYEYTLSSIKGVVFGVFANQDIVNANGVVIVKAGSCVGYCVTDEEGVATFTNPLISGQYYYKEVKTADESYRIDETEYPFTVGLQGEDARWELNRENPVVNCKYKGQIKVIKTDGMSSQALQGVLFDVYDKDKELLGTFVTDEKGEITLCNLPYGTYYLQEKQTLETYELNSFMQEIILQHGNANVECHVTNNKKTVVTLQEDTVTNQIVNEEQQKKTKVAKNVKTGDSTNVYILLCILLICCCLIGWYKRKGMERIMKMIKNMFMLLLLGFLIMVPFGRVKAAEVGRIYIDNAKTLINGKNVDATVELVQNGESYQIKVSSNSGNYLRRNPISIKKTKVNENEFQYIVSGINEDRESEYTLIGAKSEEQMEVPDVIHVTCNLYCSDSDMSETTRMSIDDSGRVNKIQVYSNMNVVIPKTSLVEEMYSEEEINVSDLQQMRCTSYKENIEWNVQLRKTGVSNAEYNTIQSQIEKRIKVYYGSAFANTFTSKMSIYREDQKVWLQPGYLQGSLQYVLNGGDFEDARQDDTYILGKDIVLQDPVRKDYRFEGWYYDKDFSELKILAKNQDGAYYIPAIQTRSEELSVYAKWSYYVVVSRDGITYRIMPDKRVSVIASESMTEAEIPDTITYGGGVYPVTCIGKGAFSGETLRKVSIGKNVTKIEEGAFEGCTGLMEVRMNPMNLGLGQAFCKEVNLFAYAGSDAYKQYEADGYTGVKTAYGSKLTYVLNDGLNSADNPDIYTWKSNLVLAPAYKEGYRFDGWYQDCAFQPASKVESICEDSYYDVVLYAKFTRLYSDAKANEDVIVPDTGNEKEIQEKDKEVVKITLSDTAHNVDGNNAIQNNMSAISKPRIRAVEWKVKKNKKVKVKIKADMAKGYCIEYAMNKKLKRRNTVCISKNQHTFTKWKKGKTYYIRICPYNYDTNGKRVYGEFTKIYKIHISK